MGVSTVNANVVSCNPYLLFSAANVDRLVSASPLKDIQHRDIIDGRIDYVFVADLHDEAIKQAYAVIIANDGTSPDVDAQKLSRFETLKALALPEHADKFRAYVAIDTAEGTWNYEFFIEHTRLYKSEIRDIGSGHTLATYQDFMLWSGIEIAMKGQGAKASMYDLHPLKAQFLAENDAAADIQNGHTDIMQKFSRIADFLEKKGIKTDINVELSPDPDGYADAKMNYEFSVADVIVFRGNVSRSDSDFIVVNFHDVLLLAKVEEAVKGHDAAADIMGDLELLRDQFDVQNAAASQILHPTVDLAQKFMQIAKNLIDKGIDAGIEISGADATLSKTDSQTGETPHTFTLRANNHIVYTGAIEKHPFDIATNCVGSEGPKGAQTPIFCDFRVSAPFTALTMAAIEIQLHSDLPLFKKTVEDNVNFVETRLQTMADSAEHRSALRAALNDPAYGSAAFTGFKPGHTDESTFIAVFGERELTLSNRSNNGEFRGQRLKEKLQHTHYLTLGDLLSAGHLTEDDGFLVAMISPSKMNFYDRGRKFMTALEREQIHHALHQHPFYNATLGTLYGVPKPEVLGDLAQLSAPSSPYAGLTGWEAV